MGVTHKAKSGALLTGTEYEAADAHNVSIAHSDTTGQTTDDHHAKAHAADHATGQSDALAAADIGAASSGHDHDGAYDATGAADSAVSAHAGLSDPHTGYQQEGTTYAFVSGATISSGSGSPEGVVAAPAGSLYLDTGGELYIKQSGSGDTGWAANVNVG